jgi:hypothetical protein
VAARFDDGASDADRRGGALVKVAALIFVGLAACSVPAVSLEGKQCPCADGYVCDMPTNRCFPSNGDGGIIDSLATTSCLGGSTTEIYRYMGTFDWIDPGGTWTGGPEIKQTSAQVNNSYTFKTNAELAAVNDYRVITSVRPIREGNAPAYGIVLRAQLSAQDKSRYACLFMPKTKQLVLESNTASIGSVTVPDAVTTMPLTMEARVVGSTLACSLREYPVAKLTGVMNTDVAAGYPGLETNRMEAAFGSFAVTAP